MSEFDDQELFQHAMLGEQMAGTPEARAEQPEGESQQRDQRGRFAAQEAGTEQPTEAPEAPEAEAERQDDPGDRPVPARRFGEVTRARDAEKARADAAEAALNEMRQQVQALTARQVPPQPQAQREAVDPIDALLQNPQAFLAQRDHALMSAIGENIVRATSEGAKAYDEAFQTLSALKQANPFAFQSAYAGIMSQPPINQARALVDWHRSHQAQQRIGGDPEAFFTRTLDERLASDPAFAKSLVERLTGQARQQAAAKPSISLPPSLNRIASAGNGAEDAGDMSDEALFAHALR